MGKKERKNKQAEWRIVIVFISILLAFAFVGTAINLQKTGAYASWSDLIANFDLKTFFFSQPSLVYFGAVGVVITYMFIYKDH